jgi:hypothetical protein
LTKYGYCWSFYYNVRVFAFYAAIFEAHFEKKITYYFFSLKYNRFLEFDKAHFCFRNRETGLIFNLTHTNTGLQAFCYDLHGKLSFLMPALNVDTRTLGSIPIERYKRLQPLLGYVGKYLNNQLSQGYITMYSQSIGVSKSTNPEILLSNFTNKYTIVSELTDEKIVNNSVQSIIVGIFNKNQQLNNVPHTPFITDLRFFKNYNYEIAQLLREPIENVIPFKFHHNPDDFQQIK